MDMIRYIKAQGKRYAAVLLRFLVLSLILFAALGCIILTLTNADSKREDKQKITIGIVGDSSISYLGFGIQAIQTIDSSRFVVTLEEMEEEQARRLLKKGEIIAEGTPAELIESMSGKVGEITCTLEQVAELQEQYKVGNIRQRKYGMALRIVGDTLPEEAVVVTDNMDLEDVYLYHFEE